MDCINHVSIDDCGPDEIVRLLSHGWRKARKEHKCSECGRTINPGESYYFESFCFDGEMQSHKTCQDCLSVRSSFFGNGYVYGRIWSDLQDHIGNCRGDIGEIHIKCLTPHARDKVCDIIQEQYDQEVSE